LAGLGQFYDIWERGSITPELGQLVGIPKVGNHAAAVALWFMYYRFCRVHRALRVTAAMEAGFESHIWTLEELVNLFELPVAEAAS